MHGLMNFNLNRPENFLDSLCLRKAIVSLNLHINECDLLNLDFKQTDKSNFQSVRALLSQYLVLGKIFPANQFCLANLLQCFEAKFSGNQISPSVSLVASKAAD